MPQHCNIFLSVDPVSRDGLNRILRSPKTVAAVYRRALAVSLLVEGVRPGEAARLARLDRTNVFRWSRRFRQLGVAGLLDLPRKRVVKPPTVAAPKLEPTGSFHASPLAEALRQIEARNLNFGDE